VQKRCSIFGTATFRQGISISASGRMLLPLGDALQNTMQNLVSRIAGVNNEELANRGIGMGAAMGHTIKSIAHQFKGDNGESKVDTSSMISKSTKKVLGPESTQVSGKSYESYSKNVMDSSNSKSINKDFKSVSGSNENSNIDKTVRGVNRAKKAYNVGKEFMNFGMYMAEGKNFRNSSQDRYNRKIYNPPSINEKEKENENHEKSKFITLEADNDN